MSAAINKEARLVSTSTKQGSLWLGQARKIAAFVSIFQKMHGAGLFTRKRSALNAWRAESGPVAVIVLAKARRDPRCQQVVDAEIIPMKANEGTEELRIMQDICPVSGDQDTLSSDYR